MLLSKLLTNVNVLNQYKDKEIADIKINSNEVYKDCLFVCIVGNKTDGHNYAQKALQKGACAILCQRDLNIDNQIIVANTKEAYAIICSNFFENKASFLKLIATTGTNGKTSVTSIVKYILQSAGIDCGMISTIQAEYMNKVVAIDRTTPDSYVLHKLFHDMYQSGVKAVAMEASSHALDQKRLYGITFDVAVFTNLSQDHLDYHKNMEEYFNAKKKLFSMANYAVVNIDDSYGERLYHETLIEKVSYSTKNENADFYADEIVCNENGIAFSLNHNNIKSKVKFAIPGYYSVYNALAAIAVCMKIGISLDTIIQSLVKMKGIKGRNEVITSNKGYTVICDYAHTPDGLENLLISSKQYAKGRIVLLFGCGGDRDKEKRPIMGQVASKYADKIVLTSDNPRTEKPGKIIADILKGIDKSKDFVVIPDRKDAIRYTIVTAKRNDIILLAGKGHEQYQILGDKKLYFDERRLVEGIIKGLNQRRLT